ncbi:MAG: nitroreductase family protein [Tannerellaceae bacterium]|jgi:nitroreductase|nr:nitroreductase family protein [Tannerellaceae bacterium]
MDILSLAGKRCSVRNYSPAPVEGDKLDYILEAARLAPSACNLQPWRLMIVTSDKGREKLWMAYKREWIRPVTVFVVVCGDHNVSWKRPLDGKDHLDVDAGIVIEHICLSAAEKDLGSCIICHFDASLVAREFNLSGSVEPLAIIPIGYPSDPDLFVKTAKQRKALNEILITTF